MIEDIVFELKVPSNTENLGIISKFIELILKKMGAEEEIFPVQLAVDEACTNIIMHSYQGERNKPLDIRCSIAGDQLTVQITDWGQPIDLSSVQAPDLTSEPESRGLGGLGIFIMQKMMDSVEYDFHVKKPNKVTMTKRLSRQEPAQRIVVYDWPYQFEYHEAVDAQPYNC